MSPSQDTKQFLERLFKKDAALWSQDPKDKDEIVNRLGWLEGPRWAHGHLAELKAFKDEIQAEGFADVVVLGMGGSSLAAYVFQQVFGPRNLGLRLHILDTTDPDEIAEVENKIVLDKTLFIAASKSGTTLEVVSLYIYFLAKAEASHFVAITDPGTPLERTATKLGFRKTFLNPPDIGGRYAAFSYFGLIPAALVGVPIGQFVESAGTFLENPASAVDLGWSIGQAAIRGQNKLAITFEKNISALGLWIEQLVAESTGKNGLGILPLPLDSLPETFPEDHFPISINSTPEQIGKEMLRWEIATVAACSAMGVNPFDQPDVESTKKKATSILAQGQKETLKAEGDLDQFLSNVVSGDYVAILAYVSYSASFSKTLSAFRHDISNKTSCATTLGYGPRYLHSTGQLHKGGPQNGHFIFVTSEKTSTLEIPKQNRRFNTIQMAQASADRSVLRDLGRPTITIDIKQLS